LNQYYTQIFDIKSNGTIIAVGDDPREGGDVIANQLKLVVDNARAYNPVLSDSTGKNMTYPSLNANYTMDGMKAISIQDGYGLKDKHHQELHL
jgi:hypothetical protein